MNDFFTWLSNTIDVILTEAWRLITTPVFSLSGNDISAGTLLYIFIGFFLLTYLSKRARSILIDRLLSKTGMEPGLSATIGTVSRFSILLIGSIILIQSAGVDLSALTVLAGALGVGIGFGLQNVTDNFISGIIILFEKPIKVGDRIDVGGVEGDVISISVRATTIQTNDNISIIVPNSEFISSRVINWSHNDRNIRFRLPVGVSYNEDPELVKKLLLEVAHNNPNVLEKPAPKVLFEGFGESSLDFELAVWTGTHADKPRILKSELYFDIFKIFKQNAIEIPFPQRDLHLRSSDIRFSDK
jgi:small-conductance mechanosensitive channel